MQLSMMAGMLCASVPKRRDVELASTMRNEYT